MPLSYDLLSQFAKVVNQDKKTNSESTAYGKVVVDENGAKYVQLDGSDQLTPLGDSSADVNADERVSVLIKNHTATVTGNISSPAARTGDVQNLGDQVTEIQKFDILVGEKIQAQEGYIKDLQADYAEVGELKVAVAEVTELVANKATIEELNAAKAEITDLVATKIDAEVIESTYATIENLEATTAKVGTLEAAYAELEEAVVEDLKAQNAEIVNLKAKDAEVENLVAEKASITDLEAVSADVEKLSANYAEVETLVADKASIKDLEAIDATIKNLDATYANIDFSNIGEAAIDKFYAVSGIIDKVTISEGVVVKELVGVTISGDLIKANTIMAEKLVVRGSDGKLYKLSTDFSALDGVTPVEEDSIHGSNIIANSITAEQISVDDLVAFDATIGGFHITRPTEDNAGALYSGVKSSADNTTQGIYMDSEGQLVVGDGSNYLKYFKDTDGTYKLDISAGSIRMGSSNKSVEETVNEAVDTANSAKEAADNAVQEVEDIEVGGRNYLSNSADEQFTDAASRAEFLKTTFDLAPFFDEHGLIEVTLSFDAYAPIAGRVQVYCQNGSGSRYSFTKTVDVTTEWARYAVTFTPTGPNEDFEESFLAFYGTYDSGVVPHVRKLKLEIGNKGTDWTPAPEDVENDISDAQSTADEAKNRVGAAESVIEQLADQLSMLVRNEQSGTLIRQDANGLYYFDISGIEALEKSISDTTNDLSDLSGIVLDANGSIDVLKSTAEALQKRTEYVRSYTDENGQPCLELGEGDSEFKVRITNTEIEFVEGSDVPAKLNRKMLVIEKAMIKQELQFGDDQADDINGVWIWKRRANGNLGLLWKEVTN